MTGPEPAGGRFAGAGTGTPQIVGGPWVADASGEGGWAHAADALPHSRTTEARVRKITLGMILKIL